MKTVLITGATAGIGKEIALALASMNYEIVFIARNREKAESVKEEIISASNNDKVDFILADLTSKKQIRASVTSFKKKYQKLDIMIFESITKDFQN